MSDYEKAMNILAYMAKIDRAAVWLNVEDILAKANHEELDYYYRWCCLPC